MSVSGARGESAVLHLLLEHSAAPKRIRWLGGLCRGGAVWHFESEEASDGRTRTERCTFCETVLCAEKGRLSGSRGSGGRVNRHRAPRGRDCGDRLSTSLVCHPYPSNPCPAFVTREIKSGSCSFPQKEKGAGFS